MQCNEAGIALIKEFEGCKLTVYLDIVGLPTVGYGHRTDLGVGTEISQDEANDLLSQDLTRFETGVTRLVTVDLTSNQFSALVCFSFNLGLSSLAGSTLLKCVNSGDFEGAAEQFLRWDRAGGQVVEGLERRRQTESALFSKI